MATRLELPKFQAFDVNGDPLSGGLIYTYKHGTDTEKATYTDRDAGTPNTNPVVLDSRGEAVIYGSGSYKLVLKTSADVTIWTVDNIRGINEMDITSIGDYSGDFDAAITAIAGTASTLYIDSAATMSEAVIVPSTCKVIIEKGGSIDQSTYNLTFNGPFECGIFQAFTGTGTVSFASGGIADIYPEWWGIDGAADDVQINLAAAAGGASKIPVCLVQDYTAEGSITLVANTTMFSKNKVNTITLANGVDASLFLVTGDNVTVRGVSADGNKANQAAGSFLIIDSPGGSIDNLVVEDCITTDFKEYGIQVEETCANHRYINNKFDSPDKSGILVSPGVDDTSDNIRIEGNHVIDAGVNGIQVYNSTNMNNSNIFITGNYVINATAVPIEIQRARHGVVSNNTIEGSGTNGISVGSCKYLTVTGNTIEDQSNYGIELADISEGGSLTVTGNSIYNCGTGIITVDGGGDYGSIAVISNNVINTTTSQEGIDCQHLSKLSICGNIIIDPNTVGIRVHGVDDAIEAINDIVVSNNTIKFEAASTSGPQGISVASVYGGIISNNQVVSDISGSSEWDAMIGIGKGCKDLYVVDNQLIGTTAITHSGITITYSNSGSYIYLLRNHIKLLKRAILSSSCTNPRVYISGNIIEESSLADITAHASHRLDKLASSPTQGSMWYAGDVVWEDDPTSGSSPGWVCTDRVKTEMRVAAVATDTTMQVDDTTGMGSGDIVGVEQDDGTWKWTTIASVIDGDTFELSAGLSDSAAIDNDVIANDWKGMANLK